MYMFVYLFLSFAHRFVPASAQDIPLRRVEREISDRHPFQTPTGDKYLVLPYGANIPKWNTPTHPAHAVTYGGQIPGRSEFESRRNPPTNLEITKSIELTFDPNNRMLTPVNDVSKANKTEDAYKSSISLLSPYTQKRLNKIFEKYDKEAKGGDMFEVKNYQTGRFKLHYLKRGRFRV